MNIHRRLRGTLELENNGPIVTIECVDVRGYEELVAAMRDIAKWDSKGTATEAGAIARAALAKVQS